RVPRRSPREGCGERTDGYKKKVDTLKGAIEYRFEEGLQIKKALSISNLETWLEGNYPQSCRALLTLAGF
ncbi:hypothetical protein ACEF17_12495, partial [Streptococcus hyovaginalis]